MALRARDAQPRRDGDAEVSRTHLYLAASAVWAVVFLVLPRTLAPYWFALLGWTSVGVAWARSRQLVPAIRRPAAIIIVAGALSLLGGVVRTVDGIVRGVDYPFPSPADAFTGLASVLFIVAILMIVHRRVRRFTLDPILDAVVGGVAVALLQWSLILLPYLRSTGAPTSEKVTNVVYSVLSLLMVVSAILALVSGSQRSTSNRFLALGLIATFALDVVATLVTAGSLSESTRLYLAPFAFVLGTAGLLHPSVRLLVSRPSDPGLMRRLTTRRIATLALALLTPPVLLLVALVSGESDRLVLPAIASLALAPLVVTRMGRLVRQNEELAALEASLRSVGERLVSAETTDDVARIITVGAEQVLGAHFVAGGLVVDPFSGGAPERAAEVAEVVADVEPTVRGMDRPSTAEMVELAGEAGRHRTAGLVVVQRAVRALLVLETSAPLGDDERNALSTLCRESAIALRAVEQTEEQVRRRSEDRFGALIDNSSDIVAILGPGMELIYVSPVARRLLGYPEIAARLDVRELVHPADAELAEKMLSDIRFGLRETVELRLRHFAGTYHWFEVVGVDLSSDPDIGGIVLNLREIGDRKQAEERLVLSEARFKALVQNSTDMVVVLDPAGTLRYASPSVAPVVGCPADEVVGASVASVFPDSDIDWARHLGDRSGGEGGRTQLVEFTFRNGVGEYRTVETSITDLRSEPAVGGFVLNARDVTDRKGMEQRLRYQATHDELTGLANRVHVLDDLDGMLGRNSGSTTVAAVLVGLDDFKDINESLGHAFGDRLLVAVAERITALLGFGDVAARVGGDEFVVVLERAHGEAQVTDLTDRILAAVEVPFEIDGRELTLSASAGIVFDHDRSHTGEILLRDADIAMYRAKTTGKRRAVVFEPHMHAASYDRLELRADLARAVEGDQLVAHYQPVVDIATRRIVGAEALIRWNHPTRGMLAPGIFIGLAEESGLIGELGEWILERAATDLAGWRDEIGGAVVDLTMSVNLSARQLQDEVIVATVSDILARSGLPADRLVLEVTESTLITDTERIRGVMAELRALGARLAVDDFGTGYSSLGYIQQFDFDVLKIDKSFVDGLESVTNQRIVTAVLDLARQLEVRTIAEGIETEDQADVLGRLGCRYGQGYLYSRPVAPGEFRDMLVALSDTGTAAR